MARFEEAIPIILSHEGGYVNDPNDAGGETNFGISKRQYPNVEIKALTREQATEIYRRDYWKPIYDQIAHQPLATKVLDLGVNCGTKTAHVLLQRALCQCGTPVTVDGNFGLKTLAGVNAIIGPRILGELKRQAILRYENIAQANPSQTRFLAGWIKRATS